MAKWIRKWDRKETTDRICVINQDQTKTQVYYVSPVIYKRGRQGGLKERSKLDLQRICELLMRWWAPQWW